MKLHRLDIMEPNGSRQFHLYVSEEKALARMKELADAMDERWKMLAPIHQYQDPRTVHRWWNSPLGNIAWRIDVKTIETAD